MSFIGYPKTPRVASLPWLGVRVPRFFHLLVFRGFRVRLWCIKFTSIPKDLSKHIDFALNKRWLVWPTCPDINSLWAGLISGGKIISFHHNHQRTPLTLLPPSLKWLTFYFSLLYHPWINHDWHKNMGNDNQVKKPECENKNSPCQHLRECTENSMENMHTDVRVWGVSLEVVWHFIAFHCKHK